MRLDGKRVFINPVVLYQVEIQGSCGPIHEEYFLTKEAADELASIPSVHACPPTPVNALKFPDGDYFILKPITISPTPQQDENLKIAG